MTDPTPLPAAPPRLHAGVHLPALDGLRGIAILCVLAMHFAIATPLTAGDRVVYALARNGWIGVDLFFVLSGFLITGILLDSRGKPGAVRSFYARRVLRIFPLYYGMLISLFVLDRWLSGAGPWLEKVQADQIWHWLYVTNFLAARNGWANIPGIGHLWSLAIEEQFYLVWPFAVLFLARQRLLPLCVAMLGVSFATRMILVYAGASPVAIYALTFTRWDGLAVGAIVAIVARQRGGLEKLGRWSAPALVLGALACVGFLSAAPYRSHYGVATQTTGYAVLALTFGALLVQVILAPAESRLTRSLADARLRFFGRYSYGIYVLHGPLLGWLAAIGFSPALLPRVWGSALPGQALYAAVALLTVTAAALLSWTFVEKPFLRLKRHFPSAATPLPSSAEGTAGAAIPRVAA
ncbi:MAG: acyltransferase [Gemmatimonadetes bacterium]|nr:acyltransferase [Gemmatimonadota bacterium]